MVGDIVEFAYRLVPRVRASKLLPAEFKKNPSVYTPDPNSTPTVVVADTAITVAKAQEPAVAKLAAVQVAMAAVDDEDDPKPVKKKAPKPAKSVAKKKPSVNETEDDKEARVKEALGPDFEKKMEALGEKIGKAMEKKFGPGSEFEKKMEAFGEEIQKKFGPEFEKKMEAFGREMEKKFGSGSEFTKEMSSLGETLAKQFGPGSEFADAMKDVEKVKSTQKGSAKAESKAPTTKPAKVGTPKKTSRADRIERLESRIDELLQELERLKADTEEDDSEA